MNILNLRVWEFYLQFPFLHIYRRNDFYYLFNSVQQLLSLKRKVAKNRLRALNKILKYFKGWAQFQ